MTALLLDAATVGLIVACVLSILCWLLPNTGGSAKHRAREALTRLLLPPAGAALAVALGFWPTFSAVSGGPTDHCLVVPGPHLCWIHQGGGGEPHDLATTLLLAAAVGQVARLAYAAWALRGRLGLLGRLAESGRAGEVREHLAESGLAFDGTITILDFQMAFCFVTGIRRPRLVLSTSLLDRLEREDVGAVLAHEIAHVNRHDTTWRLLGSAAVLFHFPGLGRRAFERWALASEAACDAAAAEHLGSTGRVVGALIRFKRLLARADERGSGFPADLSIVPGFAPAKDFEARLRGLLDPAPASRFGWTRFWPALLGFGAVWQAQSLHLLLERILGHLHL